MITRMVWLLGAALLLPSCQGTESRGPWWEFGLSSSWAIQLQGLDQPGAIDEIARSDAHIVVIEPTTSVRGKSGFPIEAAVRQIKANAGYPSTGKCCLAYLNVAQAEDYRDYWGDDWVAPTAGRPGSPEFLVSADPDGWAGNWPVAFWEPKWREILFAREGALLDRLLDLGFDGVMLDWVAAWSEPVVIAAAEQAGVDPAEEMARLIRLIVNWARARDPGFIILLNDGAPLLARFPDLVGMVNGVVRESLWFAGAPSTEWEDPDNADRPVAESQPILDDLRLARSNGLKVLTLDYATKKENIDRVILLSGQESFVPFISRTPLNRLP